MKQYCSMLYNIVSYIYCVIQYYIVSYILYYDIVLHDIVLSDIILYHTLNILFYTISYDHTISHKIQNHMSQYHDTI